MVGNLVPAKKFEVESWVKNSHFISSIAPAFTVSEAKDFIAEINKQYADATHNVPAYVIGSGASTIAHSSDDGEPSGTAGKPALAVLMGSDLGDVVLVITRYFGGTKLGTGGLVKAYSSAAKEAVEGVPRAKKIPVQQASLICPYSIHKSALRLIRLHQGLNIQEHFTEEVRIDFSLPNDQAALLQDSIRDLTNGQIAVAISNKTLIALLPIGSIQEKSTNA